MRTAQRTLGYGLLVGIAGGVGAVVTPPLAVVVLSAIGFSSAGVTTGTIAAGLQRNYGGTIVAGSAFAFAQSLAMGGAADTLSTSAVGGLGAAILAAGILLVHECRRIRFNRVDLETAPPPSESSPLITHESGAITMLTVDTKRSQQTPSALDVDPPGKVIRFTNRDLETLDCTKTPTHNTKNNHSKVPDLTGCIECVKGPFGGGTFGEIYSGEYKSLRGTELVTMKRLRVFADESRMMKIRKKFKREVRLWSSLKHPHVLPFYGTCESDDSHLYMISPWAEGGTSLDFLKKNPGADRGHLMWQTSSALEYLHSGRDSPQIVHGDLKADNVLISASGDALLSDFGLSLFAEEIGSFCASSAGQGQGNARFMAPEILLPPKDASTRPTPQSDVFGFASLMLQIYTEKLPFDELSEPQAIVELADGRLPPHPNELMVVIRGFNERIWSLMLECWKFEPSERPSMEEVMDRMLLAAPEQRTIPW